MLGRIPRYSHQSPRFLVSVARRLSRLYALPPRDSDYFFVDGYDGVIQSVMTEFRM